MNFNTYNTRFVIGETFSHNDNGLVFSVTKVGDGEFIIAEGNGYPETYASVVSETQTNFSS